MANPIPQTPTVSPSQPPAVEPGRNVRITKEFLQDCKSCPEGVDAFAERFPGGAELSREVLTEMAEKSFLPTCMARRLLKSEARRQFQRDVVTARKNWRGGLRDDEGYGQYRQGVVDAFMRAWSQQQGLSEGAELPSPTGEAAGRAVTVGAGVEAGRGE